MTKQMSVLLVEDDDVAAESITRSLKKLSPKIPVMVAENGKKALDIVSRKPADGGVSPPFIVLLDLNMPVMSGFEFLEEVRRNKDLQDLVIFILTTSNADCDLTRAYHHNVAGYMVKSHVGPQFSKLASFLQHYRDVNELKGKE